MDSLPQDEQHLAAARATVIAASPRLFGVPVPLPVFGFGPGWRDGERRPTVGSRHDAGGGAQAVTDQTQVMTTADASVGVMTEDRRHRLHGGPRKPAGGVDRSGSRTSPVRLGTTIEVAAA